MVPAIVNYRNFQKWALIVEAAGLSAIHHSCAEFIISEFQSKRGEIQSTMEDNLRLKFEGDEAYADIEILDVVSFLARQVNEQKSQLGAETTVGETAEA